jgi:hypothetical protein
VHHHAELRFLEPGAAVQSQSPFLSSFHLPTELPKQQHHAAIADDAEVAVADDEPSCGCVPDDCSQRLFANVSACRMYCRMRNRAGPGHSTHVA